MDEDTLLSSSSPSLFLVCVYAFVTVCIVLLALFLSWSVVFNLFLSKFPLIREIFGLEPLKKKKKRKISKSNRRRSVKKTE